MATPTVVTWLLTAQLVADVVLVALLGFFIWKTRDALNTLAISAVGTQWATGKLAEAFASAAASVELTATAAAASSVAIQTIARDLRPVHGQTATIDLSNLTINPDD